MDFVFFHLSSTPSMHASPLIISPLAPNSSIKPKNCIRRFDVRHTTSSTRTLASIDSEYRQTINPLALAPPFWIFVSLCYDQHPSIFIRAGPTKLPFSISILVFVYISCATGGVLPSSTVSYSTRLISTSCIQPSSIASSSCT
jgi:hypothetical protein